MKIDFTRRAWVERSLEAVDAALTALSSSAATMSRSAIARKAPPTAENRAVVGVSVSPRLPDVDAIRILVPKNASPLAARFQIGPGVQPTVVMRIKSAETTPVVAVVRSGGQFYGTSREVEVTSPGCGGAG